MRWETAAFMFSFGSFVGLGTAEEIRVTGGVVEMRFTDEASPPLRSLATDWVESAARSVAAYYGR